MKTTGCKVLLFLSAILSFSPIFAEPSAALTSEESATVKEIVSYLSEHSLSPYLQGGKSEYFHLGFIKDSYNNNTHALGMIKRGNDSYATLFSIHKSWFWNQVTTDLMYITTDCLISPVLFEDVARVAAALLEKDPSQFHVFIEKQSSHLPEESTLQKWTFFNQQESKDVFVVLTDDGKGGTYFEVRSGL